ncbi:RagB/SusD family nutrient uptake outer membrane protein [Olivibacter sp. XZL3]|uniref:RagB/SusD family nutrient uptake outer membrane protein n=1 Tax=Olivibacter sp. XZL3 TaxID=1735116 RepID=UPI0010658288|nr:RagB/SusD family nutrient uptake outer membrane protein [Olivibacter sp. XZL3]
MKKILNYISVALALSLTGCKGMLDVEPRTYVESDQAINTVLGMEAAINGAYAKLRINTYYGLAMVVYPELLADNVRLVQAATQSGRGVGYDVNNPGSHLNIWTPAYSAINAANLIIEKADAVGDGTDAEKASFKAQAYFLRALVYFDLLKTYAYNPNYIQGNADLGVPLLTEAVDDLTKITYPERATVAAGYSLVEQDLSEAIRYFQQPDVNGRAGAPFYGTKAAAHALLSRLYLYWGAAKWDAAVEQADLAIDEGVGLFQPDAASYLNMWTEPSNPESVFEVQFASINEVPQTSNNNTIQAFYQQERNGSQFLGWGDVVIASNFLSAFEQGDIRRELVVPYTRSNGEQVIQTDKFSGSKGIFGWDNVPVIRISEVYLNRAEAQAQLGRVQEAQEDLNRIRTRAGLAAITPQGADLLTAIRRERRLELAFEGQRFFDLTRLGIDISKETIVPIPFSDYRILAPLPQSEIDINSNLIQNRGY